MVLRLGLRFFDKEFIKIKNNKQRPLKFYIFLDNYLIQFDSNIK